MNFALPESMREYIDARVRDGTTAIRASTSASSSDATSNNRPSHNSGP